MAGSGLQEIMELVCAPNAVVHILSGKAYARAVRAHLLVDAALNALLLADAFQVPQILVHQEVQTVVQEDERNGEGGTVYDFAFPPMQGPDPDVMDGGNLEANVRDDTLDIAATILEKVLNGCMSPRDATREDVFTEVSNQLETHRKRLCGNRTAALWLQYMHMTDIMRKSIKAERTGNFKMHLESVKDMLPFLAAAGHNHYTKSSWLYLQQMLDLKDNVMCTLLTDIAAAPEGLFHVIRCNCKADCRSSRCSCRRHGLVCTVGCGECRGEERLNTVNKMQCLEDRYSSDEEL